MKKCHFCIWHDSLPNGTKIQIQAGASAAPCGGYLVAHTLGNWAWDASWICCLLHLKEWRGSQLPLIACSLGTHEVTMIFKKCLNISQWVATLVWYPFVLDDFEQWEFLNRIVIEEQSLAKTPHFSYSCIRQRKGRPDTFLSPQSSQTFELVSRMMYQEFVTISFERIAVFKKATLHIPVPSTVKGGFWFCWIDKINEVLTAWLLRCL